VFHVRAALADQSKTATLRLAAFDILEIDGQPFKANSYGETIAKITGIFGGAKLCGAVECKPCKSKSEVKDIYTDWVETGGAEGLVVRTEMPLIYKVKPRYTIDVAVIGFSEGTGDQKGQVRTLLLAMMPAEGEFQIVGKTGNGFDEEAKKELLAKLQPLVINSQYIETDSNHVAFHMIRPEIVIELLINDVLFDTSTGFISNAVLELKDKQYVRKGDVHGISVVFPIFARFRDDKKAVDDDIRLEQINDFSYIAPEDMAVSADLAKSELLKRAVYKKESGSKLMVQKFIVWKTNKSPPEYPAFVFHYTNFSSDRKEPLQREVAVSDDESQIMELFNASLAENIKKGWNAVS
jgi:ATP-dependent DNA ligase